MQITPSHHNCPLHLGRNHHAFKDAPANRHITGKGTLLVNVITVNGGVGCFDPEADGADVVHDFDAFGANVTFVGDKDGILGLVGFLCWSHSLYSRARRAMVMVG